MSIEETEKKNAEAYLKFVDRFWGLRDDSREFVKNRLQTKEFDPEFLKLLKDSPDQRVRWDIDFSESEMQRHFANNDGAFQMFERKFNNAIGALRGQGIEVTYKAFMDNKILYKKNETKLKKVFEIIYGENNILFARDAELRNSNNITEEMISQYIVKSFEYIGTLKKPCKKLQLVLSLNICDWILASTGGSISSCLNMEGGGNKYWAGLPLLSGDPNRAMLYISDGTKKEYEGMTVDNCMTRTWVILTKSNKKAIVRWYTSEILSLDALRSVSGDNSFFRGMDTEGKNEITPIFLKSGITTTIYMDEGFWEKGKSENGFRHAIGQKGCFQHFSEDLQVMKNNFDFRRPWNDGSGGDGWRISEFKKNGFCINDYVPLAICGKCGERKVFIKSSSINFPVCIPCYNKEFFSCDICGNTTESSSKHFHDFVKNGHNKEKKKLCSNCAGKLKKCECCGSFIYQGGLSTTNNKTVCSSCLADKTNGYSICGVCGVVSKKDMKRIFDLKEGKIIERCNAHMPVIKNVDIDANKESFVVYTRKPLPDVAPCSKCGIYIPANSLFHGVCYSCKETSTGVETLDV